MEMRLPTSQNTTQNTSQNMPFTFGSTPAFGHTRQPSFQPTSQSSFVGTPGLGCIMKPPQNLTNTANTANTESNADSEDDFPICQASLPNPNAKPLSTNCTPQFGKPGMGGLGMGIQFGQTKSNQMLFVHLKNMRAQVEQSNMMIDSLYQILSQPHLLNSIQIEQIHTQINTMRDSIVANNNSINEIYRIMSTA
jgi:hypothetical protein